MILLLLAAAAAAPVHAAPLPGTEAEAVVARQRRQPPRTGHAAGLSPEEADIVMSNYLGSIGKRLVKDSDTSSSSEPHP